MLMVKEVLKNKISLDIECVDRVYLNGYMKYLQMAGGVINFIREQKELPIPSPKVLYEITQSYHQTVAAFAEREGLEIYKFNKKEDKEQVAKSQLSKFKAKSGVVLIGKAQEKANAFRGKREKRTDKKVWFNYSRSEVNVIHYYFYILDENFGLFVIGST